MIENPGDDLVVPSFRLDGRLVVVTGASEGIGSAFARVFAASGATVVLASRSRDKLERVRTAIVAAGGRAEVVPTDVTRIEALIELAARASEIARANGEKLVLVNNAGYGFTKPAIDVSAADWDTLFDTHARATFFSCQKHAAYMLEQGYGKIINMSSTWSASSDDGKAPYSSAKAAISRLTAALSTEWARHGIRVNALAPTATMTEFTSRAMEQRPDRAERLLSRIPIGRFAKPEDLAGAAIFLASEASDFVTGQTLFVDGGWNAAGC
jgi:NAD(P)-dependent dehydrogenase (short-subunit alcohol dehydrogenase family)